MIGSLFSVGAEVKYGSGASVVQRAGSACAFVLERTPGTAFFRRIREETARDAYQIRKLKIVSSPSERRMMAANHLQRNLELRQISELAVAVGEPIHLHAHFVHHRYVQVGERRVLCVLEVATGIRSE